MQILGDPSIAPPQQVKAGDYVAFFHENFWNRARVVSVKSKQVSLYAVDIGSQATVELGELKPLQDEMLQLPAQVIK